MVDIRHRVGIKAAREEVFRALATTEGVASWWSIETTGDAGEGGKLDISFGGGNRRLTLEVVEASAERVVWRCLEGPDEWLPTTFTFALGEEAGETVVEFSNTGWVEAVPFIGHCTTKWGYYLLGLKAGLEGGTATPFPRDLWISSWG